MARHSKWANIKHRKGRQDAARSKLFSKLAKEITVAAKMGDPDPDKNPRLRLAVDKGRHVADRLRREAARPALVLAADTEVDLDTRLVRITNVEIPVDTGDFRLMGPRAVAAFRALPERNRFIRGLVSWIGFRQEAVLYDRAERHAGDPRKSVAGNARKLLTRLDHV